MYVPEIELTVKIKGKPNMLKRKASKSGEFYKIALEIFNADQIEWVEEFIMLSLNNSFEVIGFYKVSKGGLTYTSVDVRVIATIALQTLATTVIVMHNHPSGSLKPSESDKAATIKIQRSLELLDIKLLDHLIVTNNGYYSFADDGLI